MSAFSCSASCSGITLRITTTPRRLISAISAGEAEARCLNSMDGMACITLISTGTLKYPIKSSRTLLPSSLTSSTSCLSSPTNLSQPACRSLSLPFKYFLFRAAKRGCRGAGATPERDGKTDDMSPAAFSVAVAVTTDRRAAAADSERANGNRRDSILVRIDRNRRWVVEGDGRCSGSEYLSRVIKTRRTGLVEQLGFRFRRHTHSTWVRVCYTGSF